MGHLMNVWLVEFQTILDGFSLVIGFYWSNQYPLTCIEMEDRGGGESQSGKLKLGPN